MDGRGFPRMVLASASPRRKDMLIAAGYEFRVQSADIDESGFDTLDVSAEEFTKRLALAKAMTVARKYPDDLVLGADTVAECDGEIIGKAASAAEAEEITRKLFFNIHRVVTGVALVKLREGIIRVESDTTTIYPKELTEEQIQAHIKGESWVDKAGAYAIQENGDEFVERVDGSITNVMGLPMELLEQMLRSIE